MVSLADMSNEEARFVKFGNDRTKKILHQAVYGEIPLQRAIAIAYLHGIWDGWKTAENQLSKEGNSGTGTIDLPGSEV